MLRKYPLLLAMLLPLPLQAMTCPDSAQFISEGQSILEVIKICGEPVSTIKKNDSPLINGKMTYMNKDGTGVEFVINDGYTTAINEITPCKPKPCEPTLTKVDSYSKCMVTIYTYQNVPYITRSCGKPTKTESKDPDTDMTVKLYYKSNNGANVLIFHNNELVDSDYE